MNRLRSKLTYANVMASFAVFIALGGASYAATQLPKNSVGSKQLKRGAVTAAKIKNGAVTGAKIRTSSLGTVPSASQANNAAHADSATVANSIVPPEAPRLVGAPGQPPFATQWEGPAAPGITPPSFYKDREGIVHLEGLAFGSGSDGQLIFTLPSGYRPNGNQHFITFGYPGGAGGPNLVTILGNGQVLGGNQLETSLNGIIFRPD